LTVEAGRVYEYELQFLLSKTVGTTSHTISQGFGGSATFNNFLRSVNSRSNIDTINLGFNSSALGVATNPLTLAAINYYHWERGQFSVLAGGTIIPQYQLSAAPGGAYSVQAGAYMRVRDIGPAGVISRGPWA
jgi:hypothetical protein